MMNINCGVVALFKFAFHFVGRLDDSCKLRCDKITPNATYSDLALTGQLVWSKNVKEECECPKQIILGADNPDYCVLFGLGLHLVKFYSNTWYV